MTIRQADLKKIIHYDPGTGKFTWLKSTSNQVRVGDECGTVREGNYRRISIDYIRYPAAHLACLYMDGKLPPNDVEHINGDVRDCAWANLKHVTKKKPKRYLRTGVRGVTFCEKIGMWRAVIREDNKVIQLGDSTDFATAVKLRKDAEYEHGYR